MIVVSPALVHSVIALVLAFVIPPLGIVVARDALDATRQWGMDESIPRLALLCSIFLTIACGLVLVIGFASAVVVPLLSGVLR